MVRTLLAVPIVLFVPLAFSASTVGPAPAVPLRADTVDSTVLFSSSEPITLTLRMDVRTVLGDRDSTKQTEYPAQIVYLGPEGEPVTIDLEVRTRGHFRRQVRNCNFPPLRLDFPRDSTPGTLFANQDKLKLVTPCQKNRDDYQRYVLLEYLAYRMYNVLSDHSFRVRLLDITYEDTAAREEPLSKYAFVIEDEDEMAARLGGRIIEAEAAHPSQLEWEEMTVVSVFQYMIGNTDWSAARFHNVVLIEVGFSYIPVPYDFDWSGIVSARYARPDARLRTRHVTQRVFRGFCRDPEQFAFVFDVFRQYRESLYATIDDVDPLDEGARRETREYLDEFFETIDNPGRARREIVSACRDMG